MKKIEEMVVFANVVEHGGFSAAARKLGLTTPAVSKHVARLEEHMKTRLLNRTTRSVTLTEAGAAVYEHCARIVEELALADETLERLRSEPSGRLRVTCTLTFGMLHVAPLLADFLGRYPHISVALSFNDRIVDIAAEGYDLAIRISSAISQGLVTRQLAPIHNIVCASPAYLDKHGTPVVPGDLLGHNCLQSFVPGQDAWSFSGPDGDKMISRVSGNLQANSGTALRVAALNGLGIARLPSYIVGSDLRAGTLVQVLPDYALPGGHVQAVYARTRHLPAKTRVFLDFLVERLKGAI